jgi:hypothetical protein
MRQLMDERAELFGLRLTGQECDPAAVAHLQRRRNALAKGKLDALFLHECEKTFTVLAYVAADLAYGGKLCAIGLADILSRDLRPAWAWLGVSLSRSSFCLRLVMMGARISDAALALLHVAA